MFYEKTFISSLLKCQHCEQSYDDHDQPSITPCGKTICNKCVSKIERQIKNNSFQCILCDEKHYLSENSTKRFPINELAISLIEAQPKEIYRGKEIENFKISLQELDNLLNELTFNINNGNDKIKYHCSELKRLVQLSTENKIIELNNLNELLVKKIDDYEKECTTRYSNCNLYQSPLNEIIAESNLFLSEKRSYLQQYEINENEVIQSNQILNRLKSSLEDQLLNVKSILFNNNLMEFEMNKTKIDENKIGSFYFNKLYSTKTKIISGSDDNLIKIWDLNTGECIKSFQGHEGEVNCLEVISDNIIVSGSSDKTIKVWDLNTASCLKTLIGHTDWVNCLQRYDHFKIISGSGDHTIKVWDLNSGVCCKTLEGHNGSAMCIQLLTQCDENKIIIGSDDWTIKIFDLLNEECLGVLEGHSDQVWMLRVYSKETVISASADKTIKIWNIDTESCLKTLKSHTGLVYWIEILSKDRILSCSHDKTIKIWNIETGNCLKTLRGHSGPVDCIEKISNDRIVSCSVDNTVKIWDLNTGNCLDTYSGHTDEVNCVIAI